MPVGILLAAIAAVAIGTGDFLGGVIGRRDETAAGMLWVFVITGAYMIPGALLINGFPTASALGWGFIWGCASPIALYTLILGVAHGRVIVVIPVSGFTAAAVPVALDVLTGGRPEPLVWIGVALGVIAVVLLGLAPGSIGERSTAWSISMGLIGGGITGLGFVVVDHAAHAGLWLLGAGSLTATILTAIVLLARSESLRTPRSAILPAAAMALVIGLGLAAAIAAFERASLTAAAIVISQYPAATLFWLVLVWKQRPRIAQYIGAAMTLAAVAVIASA